MIRTLEQPSSFSKEIQAMFTAIAPRYDFLNGALSFGRDRYWREFAVDALAPQAGERFLDVATGTADVALEIASRHPTSIKVSGVDFSRRMLQLGQRKVCGKNLDSAIGLQSGNAENLPFADNSFHGAICAFGVRNFADVRQGLSEMWRTLKPGGKAVILEFSMPRNFAFKWVYRFYFGFVLPFIGRIISGHQIAYSYLPRSVSDFPGPSEFREMMEESGFKNVTSKDLTFGIATVYAGLKKSG
ncbi:MAG: bifunctional demethylmenaquinone methyltransferase/2-methoxy-6-polyprenyl-1,4-benzoquinol methylase UbiE [Nitrospinales bacterium]